VVAGKPVQPEVCPRCGVENPRVYTRLFVETPQADAKKETEGGQ